MKAHDVIKHQIDRVEDSCLTGKRRLNCINFWEVLDALLCDDVEINTLQMEELDEITRVMLSRSLHSGHYEGRLRMEWHGVLLKYLMGEVCVVED